MPRISGGIATDFTYRVTQRGNYEQCGFEDKGSFIKKIEGLFGWQLKDLSRRRF